MSGRAAPPGSEPGSGARPGGQARGFLETRIPPPIWWLAAMFAMWLLNRYAPLARVDADVSRAVVGGFAGAIALVGLVLTLGAIRRFAEARTTVHPLHPEEASRLVVVGAYQYTRNPMYLGLLLILVGWAVWLGGLSVWFVLPAFVVVLTHVQIVPEERALEAKFGEDYRAYRREVRRWFGRRASDA